MTAPAALGTTLAALDARIIDLEHGAALVIDENLGTMVTAVRVAGTDAPIVASAADGDSGESGVSGDKDPRGAEFRGPTSREV